MGGANGSRDPSAVARRAKAECAPDDKLRDTHRVTTHAKQADGFRKRSTHPAGWGNETSGGSFVRAPGAPNSLGPCDSDPSGNIRRAS